MFRRTAAWRGVAALGAAALVLAACADDTEDPENDTPPAEAFDGTLTVGAILPTTGGLADYGIGMIAAVELAVAQINEAGGVWGNDVVLLTENEGPTTEPEVVLAAADAMIAQGVNAVVGAASSTSSERIIEALFNEQIVMISPSNTGPGFTDHEFGEFYFRTAPSDLIQGDALAEEIIEDGHPTLGILAQQTVYGEGLANQIAAVYEAGGGEVVYQEFYDEAQTEFSSEIAALVDEDPDAFVLVSYAEARQIIPSLIGAGFTPQDKQWYFVDGNRLDYSEDFDDGVMAGVKASQPIVLGEEIIPQVAEHYGQDTPETAYLPESYDAMMLLALAAVAANDDSPTALRDAMIAVTTGANACATFAECADLLADGQDITYTGVTSTIFTSQGDPAEAIIGIFEYQEDNTFSEVGQRTGRM
jgi:ABC-type branched-subunit amino acid transport system substrate-binding protein